MADFSPGSEFNVTEETIELYYDGDLTEFQVDYIKINSISDDSVSVSHYGSDPRLPIIEKVSVSDIADAIGDWIEPK